MTRCEICGKLSFDVMPIKLEGTVMHACPMCAKYGEPERIQKPTPSLKKRNLRTKKSSSQRRTGFQEDPRGVSPGFGDKIRSVRESKGWTREQLAQKLQVKESYLAKLELEKIHPNDKCLVTDFQQQKLGCKILRFTTKICYDLKLRKTER